MSDLLKDVAPHLMREWLTAKNQGVAHDSLRVNSAVKVWWQCQVDPRHQWVAGVRRRAIDGNGCPYCSGRRVLREDSFAAKHPTLAAELHPSKNGDFDPYAVAPFCNRRVWWQCSRDPKHVWQCAIGSRVRYYSGCRQCNSLKNTVASKYPELVKEWHPTLNEKAPHEVPSGARIVVWWQCTRDPSHVWKTRLDTRRRGTSGICPECRKAAGPPRRVSLAEHDSELARQWHPTKNGSVTPDDVLPTSHEKAWWICPRNPRHEWQASIRNRAMLGAGCQLCARSCRRPQPGQSLADLFPDLARQWHPSRNGDLRPEDVTRGSSRRVWWQCESDPSHVWDATVTSRAAPRSKRNCPFCSGHFVTEKNSLAAHYPQIAKEWHKEKNGSLTPDAVSKASGKKVWWQCSKNAAHSWPTQIKNRTILGTGCPHCEQENWSHRLQSRLLDAAQANPDFLATFTKSMNVLRRLAQQEFPDYLRLQQPLYRMLYAAAVTAMETYLSDAFSQLVLRHEELVEKLMLTTPEFQDRRYALSEVIEWQRQTRKRVGEYLYDVVWHNLAKISRMYHSVLKVAFPEDMDAIYRAVTTRHDLVHRNGRTKKGSLHRFSRADIEGVISDIEAFVARIDDQVKKWAPNKTIDGDEG